MLTRKACTEESVYVYVREAFLVLEQRKSEVVSWTKQMHEITEVISLDIAQREAILQELQDLWRQTNAKDEQAFYEAHGNYIHYMEKVERLNFVNQQIEISGLTDYKEVPSVEDLESQLAEIDIQQSVLQAQVEELLNEKAALQYSTDSMLTDKRCYRNQVKF